jgi:hypothetical protein
MIDGINDRLERVCALCGKQPLQAHTLCVKIRCDLKRYRDDLEDAVDALGDREIVSVQLEHINAMLEKVAGIRDSCERRILEMHPPNQ